MLWSTGARTVYFDFFFFNDTATTEIYTLSLHDALPISARGNEGKAEDRRTSAARCRRANGPRPEHHPGSKQAEPGRSEEHTSELQSRQYLVCRLLLEKKNNSLPQPYPDHPHFHIPFRLF